MRSPQHLVSLVVLLAVGSPYASAGDWPQFRGPFYNGTTDEKGLPTSWSETENVAWIAELPGPSAATPAVWGDRVFVSSTDAENGSLKALCLDRKTGKKLWEHQVATGVERDKRSNYASSSPATDGKVVVFLYGRGELISYDLAGKELWSRKLAADYGEFAFQWTYGTSPVLHGGKLYVQVLQRDTPVSGRGFSDRANDSYLLALDPASGKELWRRIRPSKARAESREAFSTPIVHEREGKSQLLVVGGDALTGHDLDTGEELWRWGTWNPKRVGHWRHVPSPVVGDEIVLVCAPKRDPIYAIKTGGKGKLGDDGVAWVSREDRQLSSDVPTPAFYDGDFFILSDVRKVLTRVEPRTGKVKWTLKTPGLSKYEASPTVADGKVYLINFKGDVVIVDAGKGTIINSIETNATAEYPVRSSIVAAHGQIFVRLNRKLICVGKS